MSAFSSVFGLFGSKSGSPPGGGAESKETKSAEYEIFPVPANLPVSPIGPTLWPGITSTSTAALQEILKDNHARWNIFFNDSGFHNHITHHALALWFLGAPKPILDEGYKRDCEVQRPIFESPETITEENFNDHLGDKRFWKSYLDFFSGVVKEIGPHAALEKYVFSDKFNLGSTDKTGKTHPEMLNRFVSGLIHPMIHTGNGFEFKLPGMVMEGLAETAVHSVQASSLHPKSLFTDCSEKSLAAQLQTALKLGGTPSTHGSEPGLHAFSVLARILKDEELRTAADPDEDAIFQNLLENFGDKLYEYARLWAVGPDEIFKKIEELQWMNTMFYALPGYKEGRHFSADFTLMHLVTSSLFVPSLVASLSPSSQVLLLRSYFATSVSWWVARGRPALDIEPFFAADTAHPIPPGKYPPPQKWHLPSPSSPLATTPNSWLSIIQRTLIHPDDHLPKIQRALAHYGQLYGGTPAGYFKGTELPGAEKLDGTLFIRAAGLTADRMGRESDDTPFWDRDGFFE